MMGEEEITRDAVRGFRKLIYSSLLILLFFFFFFFPLVLPFFTLLQAHPKSA